MLRQISLAAAIPPVFTASLDLSDELLGVDGRKREVENALDGYGQTDHEAEEHGKHPLPAAFEELLHHHVVHRLAGDLGLGSHLICGLYGLGDSFCGSLGRGFLREHINSAKSEDGDRQNQKKFFIIVFDS